MKVLLDHTYLTIDFRSDEHAEAVPGGSEPGDLHYKRTKIELHAVGSINPGGLDSILATLTPLVLRGFGMSTEHAQPPGRPVPRVAESPYELTEDIECMVSDAIELGLTYDELMNQVIGAAHSAFAAREALNPEPRHCTQCGKILLPDMIGCDFCR